MWIRAYAVNDLRVFFIPEPLYFYHEDLNVTKDKILRGYRVGREIVRKDAVSRFPFHDKMYVIFRSYFKGWLVLLAAHSGRMDIIRNRRNKNAVSGQGLKHFMEEIEFIKRFSF